MIWDDAIFRTHALQWRNSAAVSVLFKCIANQYPESVIRRMYCLVRKSKTTNNTYECKPCFNTFYLRHAPLDGTPWIGTSCHHLLAIWVKVEVTPSVVVTEFPTLLICKQIQDYRCLWATWAEPDGTWRGSVLTKERSKYLEKGRSNFWWGSNGIEARFRSQKPHKNHATCCGLYNIWFRLPWIVTNSRFHYRSPKRFLWISILSIAVQ
jgi:hypothetical protein